MRCAVSPRVRLLISWPRSSTDNQRNKRKRSAPVWPPARARLAGGLCFVREKPSCARRKVGKSWAGGLTIRPKDCGRRHPNVARRRLVACGPGRTANGKSMRVRRDGNPNRLPKAHTQRQRHDVESRRLYLHRWNGGGGGCRGRSKRRGRKHVGARA